MAEASVPQDLSLAKFILYLVLIFNKSCEKTGTVYLYSLQYYDFILKTLPVKWQKSALTLSLFLMLQYKLWKKYAIKHKKLILTSETQTLC